MDDGGSHVGDCDPDTQVHGAHMHSRWSFRPMLFALIVTGLAVRPVLPDTDEIEGPWGTIHRDLAGTAYSADLPFAFGEGPVKEALRVDILSLGQKRRGNQTSITFDNDGNLYWVAIPTDADNPSHLISADPTGAIRWFGHDSGGKVHSLGGVYAGASAVVGGARVYVIGSSPPIPGVGDPGGLLTASAYDKTTGEVIWSTDLSPSAMPAGAGLTPVLYKGKLYVLGVSGDPQGLKDVYRLDAETGSPDWSSTIDEVQILVHGQVTFVPEAFGAGVHGLYFNGDGGGPGAKMGVFGIKISDTEATFSWANEGGKVARSHMIYSASANRLYALTWADYGNTIYVYDPVAGFISAHQNHEANGNASGHGFFDVGALDIDDTIIAGGFNGNI